LSVLLYDICLGDVASVLLRSVVPMPADL